MADRRMMNPPACTVQIEMQSGVPMNSSPLIDTDRSGSLHLGALLHRQAGWYGRRGSY
jgi:hypothetical protein